MSFRFHIGACGILIFIVFAAVFSLSLPQQARAQEGAISCAALFGLGGGSSVAAGAAGTQVPVVDPTLVQKECIDSIAYGLANATIEAMSRSVINWINSGFQGSPVFVTDLEEFLYLVGVEHFEDFLGSDAIAFICSPWRFDIELALQAEFFGPDVPACSLGEVVDNIDGFLAGDFSQGGWDGWFELTTRNNPYSDYLQAQAALNARIASAQFQRLELLNYGRGFLSWEDCTERPSNPGGGTAPGGTRTDCEIVTPGVVIEQQLNNVLGINTDRLVLADEINEIASAFISQLIVQTLRTGLRELSD